MVEKFKSSERMLASDTKAEIFQKKYPWESLEIGESFPVSYDDAKLTSLRPFMYRMGKKLGRRFRVVDYPEKRTYEVGRRPDKNSSLDKEEEQDAEVSQPLQLKNYPDTQGFQSDWSKVGKTNE